ncbi:MAG: hypothetical protein JRI45_02805 [Deltaproteobacteria bacterium]|nr:hypothetical protein [Deltaproteobacteria bacterium]MBW2068141.1 hypothetical protein [Deltaproteobacteria bacterium]
MRSKVINIQLAETIKLPMHGLLPNLERKLLEKLIFPNPEYEKRHMMGMWIGNIPPTISCIRRARRYYIIPRGFFDELIRLFQAFKQPYRIIDHRRFFDPIFVDFHGYLKEYQQEAAEAVLEKDFATIVGGYKSGKTVIALYTVAERKQPTLIMIPKLDLLEDWLRKIRIFLQIPEEEIGLFIRGQKKLGSRITIAHTSEVLRNWKDLQGRFGYVILDDANRCPHRILTQIALRFDSKYMLGLCHEMDEQDKLSKILTFYLGDVVYKIDLQSAREGRGIIKAHVIARPTDFDYPYKTRMDYLPMIQALMEDPVRTVMIIEDVLKEIQAQNFPIAIVTGGPIQEDIFHRELTDRGIKAQKIMISYENDREILPIDLKGNVEAYVLTSQTLIRCHERLKIKALFLAIPLYFHDELSHAIRQLINMCAASTGNNRLKIYDYVDKKIGLLENYFRMRSYNYGIPPDVLLAQNT